MQRLTLGHPLRTGGLPGTGTPYGLDSSGLAVLLAAADLAQACGAALHVAGLQPRVAWILEITGAVPAIRVYEQVEQALAAVERLNGTQIHRTDI